MLRQRSGCRNLFFRRILEFRTIGDGPSLSGRSYFLQVTLSLLQDSLEVFLKFSQVIIPIWHNHRSSPGCLSGIIL